MLTIALPKGRILPLVLPLLERCGLLSCAASFVANRQLVYPSILPGWQMIVVRAYDVPAFVDQGAADIGITGKDVLMEQGAYNHYELLDLGLAECRLMTACAKGRRIPETGIVRVASKFPKITKRYFSKKGRQVEVIKFHGAIELAPIMDISDCIVDVVDTGKTLRMNDLKALDTVANSSARLIVNKIRVKTDCTAIRAIMGAFQSALIDFSE